MQLLYCFINTIPLFNTPQACKPFHNTGKVNTDMNQAISILSCYLTSQTCLQTLLYRTGCVHSYWYIGLLFQSWLAVECRQTVRDAVRSERRPLWSCHLAPWSEFGNLSVHFMIFIIFMIAFCLSVSADFKGNHLEVGSSLLVTFIKYQCNCFSLV